MCVCVCPYRVGSFAFPAVWVESFLFVCEGFGLYGERPPLLTSHFLPSLTKEDADRSETHTHITLQLTLKHTTASQHAYRHRAHPPVVLAWVHLCVLHPEFLGKQHEGVHWPLALNWRSIVSSCCACLLAFGWLLTGRVGVAGTVGVCRFKTDPQVTGFLLGNAFSTLPECFCVLVRRIFVFCKLNIAVPCDASLSGETAPPLD